jgi:hypothetical protein
MRSKHSWHSSRDASWHSTRNKTSRGLFCRSSVFCRKNCLKSSQAVNVVSDVDIDGDKNEIVRPNFRLSGRPPQQQPRPLGWNSLVTPDHVHGKGELAVTGAAIVGSGIVSMLPAELWAKSYDV